jgi:hypothetical protein
VDNPTVQILAVARKSHFSKEYGMLLEPIQPSIQWVPGFFCRGYNSQKMKLTPHPRIVPELKMNRAIPLLLLYASTVKTETTVPLEKIQCNGKKITQHSAVISNILLLCFIVI